MPKEIVSIGKVNDGFFTARYNVTKAHTKEVFNWDWTFRDLFFGDSMWKKVPVKGTMESAEVTVYQPFFQFGKKAEQTMQQAAVNESEHFLTFWKNAG